MDLPFGACRPALSRARFGIGRLPAFRQPNPVDFGQRDGVETQKFEIDLTLSNGGSSTGTTHAYFGSPGQFESGSFGVENKNCAVSTGYYLPAGGSCQLTVTFRPHNLTVGQKNAQLTLDWSGEDILVPLSATVIDGLPDTHLAASPSSVNFGTLDPSVNHSYGSEVTLENDGGNPIFVKGYFGSEGQASSGPFSVQRGACSMASGGRWFLQSRGETCAIVVSFNPHGQTLGQHGASLVLDSNANAITIPLSATVAYSGSASASTTDLDLGEVLVDSFGSATLTLSSTSAVPLQTGSFEITEVVGSEYPGAPFTFSKPGNCDGMTSGQSCDITITFSPQKGWAYEGNLRLVGNFSPITVKLRGTGTGMRASVSPELDFGERIVNTSTTLTTPVVSTGNSPIDVESVVINGPGASSYSLQYDNSQCQGLNYRERCELQVTYSPTDPGTHPANLVVTGDFLTRTIQLTGSSRNLTPKLSIRLSGPKKIKRGRTLILKAKISNTGDLDASSVALKTMVPKKLARKVPPIRIKVLPYGKSVTRTIRTKVKKTAKKGGTLKVRLTASGPNFKTASASRAARIK